MLSVLWKQILMVGIRFHSYKQCTMKTMATQVIRECDIHTMVGTYKWNILCRIYLVLTGRQLSLIGQPISTRVSNKS